MKSKFKIIFVDIDWTILDHHLHDWDYLSIDALKDIQKQGVLIYLNTARPYDSIVNTGLLNLFKPDGIVCTNGGVIFVNDELIFENIIPENLVKDIEKCANKHHLVLELSTSKERYFTNKPNIYVERYFSVYAEVKPEIRKYQNKGISSILLFAPKKYDEILKKEFPQEMNLLRFDDHGVDISYYKNTKGEAVKKVLEYLHIKKEESISFGDSFDDISMFNETGLSIAMGNGTIEAQESAKEICDTISNHGVAKKIKEIF